MADQNPTGKPHPTLHAFRVFGGALGMALLVAGISVGAADWGPAFEGCTRCRAFGAGAVAAIIVGLVLVRSAWKSMRVRPPGNGGAR